MNMKLWKAALIEYQNLKKKGGKKAPVPVTVKQRILSALENKGMTLAKLSAQTDINAHTLSSWRTQIEKINGRKHGDSAPTARAKTKAKKSPFWPVTPESVDLTGNMPVLINELLAAEKARLVARIEAIDLLLQG